MSAIRIIGWIIGFATALFVFQRFRHGRMRRFDFLWGMIFAFGLMIVSINPDTVNLLRDMLSLKEDQFSRLIALVVASTVALWLLLFVTRSRIDVQSVQFDRLVRHMGVTDFRQLYPDKTTLGPVLVVIPAYNEEDNIGAVLRQMPKTTGGKEISVLVIDDGSDDATFEVVRQAGHLAVKSPINRGGGAALRLGFDVAKEFGVEVVVTMDADGQHLPREIEGLVAPILDDMFDIVIGSRILGEREKDSLIRYVGIHVFNSIIRILTPVKITDCSSGFRAFRTSQLGQVLLMQDQFHTAELIIDAARKGMRIGEAPITIKRRLSGESKKGKNWSYGLNFMRTVVKTWWR